MYLCLRIAHKRTGEQGCFTYTDMDVLIDKTMTYSLGRLLIEVCKVGWRNVLSVRGLNRPLEKHINHFFYEIVIN